MGRILAIDLGDRRVGLAVSDESALVALGAGVYHRKGTRDDINAIINRSRELECTEIVVGLPKNMNGTLGPRALKSMEFAKELENRTGLQVRLWDERLTTMEAERLMIDADVSRRRRKQVIDEAAAILILEGYLASRRI